MYRPLISTFALAALALTACSGDGEPSAPSTESGSTAAVTPPPMTGRWTLTDINGQAPLASAEAWLELDLAAGEISGSAGCNRFSTAFEGKPDALTMGAVAATKKMCAENVMAQEAALLAVLTAVTSVSVDDAGALQLTGTAGKLTASAPQ